MMSSNFISRLRPTNPPTRSIYDDLRAHDEASDSDVEERAAMALDEQNLGYHDDDLGNEDLFNGGDSHITSESTAFLAGQDNQRNRAEKEGREKSKSKSKSRRSKWLSQSPRLLADDGDDDVPASLLIEDHNITHGKGLGQMKSRQSPKDQFNALPGPSSTAETRAHWDAVQAQQRLHDATDAGKLGGAIPARQHMPTVMGTPRDRAMWKWANIGNLDIFMTEVYEYYQGSGIWCIILSRALNLLQIIFVAVFTTFLTQCIDIKQIPYNRSLSQVLIPQCTKNISGFTSIMVWLFTLYIIFEAYQLLSDIPRLMWLKEFYFQLLEVPDTDMQSISWQEIVSRVMALRESNPVTAVMPTENRKYINQDKQRLEAHAICNRILRKDNYLIALYNKEILDLTVPVPFLRDRQVFSRALQWNIEWCILGLVFNESGQIRQLVLKDSKRRELSDALRARFLFTGFMNAIFAPVIVMYLMIVYFFKYFNEYQKNPSALGARQYTPLAEWKFREFNELNHMFRERMNLSYPSASRYLAQFPKVKTTLLARFVAFVAGAVVSVLAVATLWDPELFLGFEITPERTVIFYVGIFGAIWAMMNGSIPDENLVYKPEEALEEVIFHTHYRPEHWKGRLHTDDVRREFSGVYQLKIVIFLEEILSIIVTPFILWFSLPNCSDQIIDFFREFTVHVSGVGYICSFAEFNTLQKSMGKRGQQTSNDIREDYYSTKNGKMMASYISFMDQYHPERKASNPPSGARQAFNHLHEHPGLSSANIAADIHSSRMGRSERRPAARGSTALPPSGRTPRFAAAPHNSPMPSILLDQHHQPSNTGFDGRSAQRASRSRYQTPAYIKEEAVEDENEATSGTRTKVDPRFPMGLDESRWETSPTRGLAREENEEEEADGEGTGAGVLGLLYQFQKAQTGGRPGNI